MRTITTILVLASLVTLQTVSRAQDEHDHGPAAQGAAAKQTDDHGTAGQDGDDHEEQSSELVIELSPEAIALAGIVLSRAQRGRIARTLDLPGEVGFNEDRLVHVAPRFPGIALEAKYRVGDYVDSGDVIAVIESNESMTPYSIAASLSGWIIERHIMPGEYVSEVNSIYVLADLSTVWVNLAVYPKDADLVRRGLAVQIQAIGSDREKNGVIDYVTPILNVHTRSLTARVVLPNPDNSWRPGTFVTARLVSGALTEGLVVEKEAVQVLDDEHVVFVTAGPGRFRPVDVITGESDARYVRIISGLAEGEEHVARGAFELKAKIVTSSLGGHAGHGH